jgi:hypothetical protein
MGTDDIAKKRIAASRKAKEDRKLAKRSAGNRSLIPKVHTYRGRFRRNILSETN